MTDPDYQAEVLAQLRAMNQKLHNIDNAIRSLLSIAICGGVIGFFSLPDMKAMMDHWNPIFLQWIHWPWF